jgi:hypothetical protein
MALNACASVSYRQYVQPLFTSSAYTRPAPPTNTRPSTIVGCPDTVLAPGYPKAHFNASRETSVARMAGSG